MRYATPYTPLEVDYNSEKLDDIEKYLTDLIEVGQMKSVAFAMSRNGKKFVERSLGEIEEDEKISLLKPDAFQEISPLTGLLLGASMLALIEDGKLYYETSVVIKAEQRQLTIDQLMQLVISKKNLVDYQTAWTIIGKASGQATETYIKKRIFDPCKMDNTFCISQLNAEHSTGIAAINDTLQDLKHRLKRGLPILQNSPLILSNPSDLLHFGLMIMQNGRYGDREVLRPESVERLEYYLQKSDNHLSLMSDNVDNNSLEKVNRMISSSNLLIHKKEGIVAAWMIPSINMDYTYEVNRKVMDEILSGCLAEQSV